MRDLLTTEMHLLGHCLELKTFSANRSKRAGTRSRPTHHFEITPVLHEPPFGSKFWGKFGVQETVVEHFVGFIA